MSLYDFHTSILNNNLAINQISRLKDKELVMAL